MPIKAALSVLYVNVTHAHLAEGECNSEWQAFKYVCMTNVHSIYGIVAWYCCKLVCMYTARSYMYRECVVGSRQPC